jgi:hypothetical protein
MEIDEMLALQRKLDAMRREMKEGKRDAVKAGNTMSPEDVRAWLEAMVKAGRAENDGECALLLGMDRSSMTRLKRYGGRRITALACAALLADLKPYGG